MTLARRAASGFMVKCTAVAATALVLGGAPGAARALTLQIDSAASVIQYSHNFTICYPDDSGQIVCPDNTPQALSISGTLELAASPYGDPAQGLQQLVIAPLEAASPAFDVGFLADPFVGLLEGDAFTALDDASCSFPGYDLCVIFAGWPLREFGGTWDGRTLALSGSQTDVFSRFDFSIRAVAAAVPEPGTLMLALPLLGVLLGRRGRSGR